LFECGHARFEGGDSLFDTLVRRHGCLPIGGPTSSTPCHRPAAKATPHRGMIQPA
jgi:hypothetical protein